MAFPSAKFEISSGKCCFCTKLIIAFSRSSTERQVDLWFNSFIMYVDMHACFYLYITPLFKYTFRIFRIHATALFRSFHFKKVRQQLAGGTGFFHKLNISGMDRNVLLYLRIIIWNNVHLFSCPWPLSVTIEKCWLFELSLTLEKGFS